MLYKLQKQRHRLCVLSIGAAVLELPGTVIADGNASSDYTRFAAAPEGLQHIDRERVFAKYWTHDNPFEEWRHKATKCAEVLVPDRIDPKFIQHIKVANEQSQNELRQILDDHGVILQIVIDKYLFFQ